jgi:hypothetical protein
MVDLSHVSPDAAEQGLKCTDAPVMFSHSNARGVFDCPRNVPDSVLDLVPANNGIVMVTFVPEHLAARRSEATVDMLLDHLFYIANRIGWEHVGLGSDFDGKHRWYPCFAVPLTPQYRYCVRHPRPGRLLYVSPSAESYTGSWCNRTTTCTGCWREHPSSVDGGGAGFSTYAGGRCDSCRGCVGRQEVLEI